MKRIEDTRLLVVGEYYIINRPRDCHAKIGKLESMRVDYGGCATTGYFRLLNGDSWFYADNKFNLYEFYEMDTDEFNEYVVMEVI